MFLIKIEKIKKQNKQENCTIPSVKLNDNTRCKYANR